jgi:hypothetical protein
MLEVPPLSTLERSAMVLIPRTDHGEPNNPRDHSFKSNGKGLLCFIESMLIVQLMSAQKGEIRKKKK